MGFLSWRTLVLSSACGSLKGMKIFLKTYVSPNHQLSRYWKNQHPQIGRFLEISCWYKEEAKVGCQPEKKFVSRERFHRALTTLQSSLWDSLHYHSVDGQDHTWPGSLAMHTTCFLFKPKPNAKVLNKVFRDSSHYLSLSHFPVWRWVAGHRV